MKPHRTAHLKKYRRQIHANRFIGGMLLPVTTTPAKNRSLADC
jgi:hypothetical protein